MSLSQSPHPLSMQALRYGWQVGKLSEAYQVHSVFDNSVNLISCSNYDCAALPPLLHITQVATLDEADLHAHQVLLAVQDFRRVKAFAEVYLQVRRQQKAPCTPLTAPIHVNYPLLNAADFSIVFNVADEWRATALQQQHFSPPQQQWINTYLQQRQPPLSLKLWHDAYQRIQNLVEAYMAQGRPQILMNMMGLGMGLTPSGDDFLLGLCAAFHANQHPDLSFLIQHLNQEASERTTEISQHFLQAAAQGWFSQSLIAFNALNHTATRFCVQKACHAVLNKGATSGLDTLLGYMTGLSLTSTEL